VDNATREGDAASTVARMRQFLALVALLTAEVAAVVAGHRLGTLPWLRIPVDDLAAWLAYAPPEDAVLAVLRLVALAGGYWLLGTTALYVLARLSRAPAALRAVRWATLPAVRRLADRAVVVTLALTTVAGPRAALAAAEPVPVAVAAPVPFEAPAPAPAAPTAAPPLEAPRAPAAREHVVVAGDNLWTVAAAQLAGDARPREVDAYWRRLIAANLDTLRSGDPNLIYQGERLTLPG
jgi:hypothetical protein